MGIAGAGMFGVFLFLTFYLQNTLGFSPIQSGLAFLPMSAAIIATATTATTRLVPRIGPKPLVLTGMTLAAVAMAFFAQLEVDSTYALHILPGLCSSASASASSSRRPSAPRPWASHPRTPASPRRWSTPASRSAARSAPRCSARSPAAPSSSFVADSGAQPRRPRRRRRPRLHDRVLVVGRDLRLRRRSVSSIVLRSGATAPSPATAPAGAEPVMAHSPLAALLGIRRRGPVTPDRRLLALDGRRPQGGDHLLGAVVGDLDDREAVGDLDRADRAAVDARLARDRAHQVARADAARRGRRR